jgi:ABC-2 type transport system permease protein
MFADLTSGGRWLNWLTPFGWSEQIESFVTNDWRPLAPLLGVVAMLSIASVRASSRRDVRGVATLPLVGAWLARRLVRARRSRNLRGPLGLSWHLMRANAAAWLGGIAVIAALYGLVLKVVVHAIDQSTSTMNALERLGAVGGGVTQFLAVTFLLLAVAISVFPTGVMNALSDEELSGRLALVLSTPVTRARFLAGRVAIATVAVVATALVSGVVVYLAGEATGLHLDCWSVLSPAINVIPVSLVTLAVGMLALTFVPRFAGLAVYVVVGWSFVAYMLGSLIRAFGGIDRSSIYHYLSLAPAIAPNWRLDWEMAVGALVVVAASIEIIRRRDLVSD